MKLEPLWLYIRVTYESRPSSLSIDIQSVVKLNDRTTMSLNLTPVSTPQGKPLPPSRSKRVSTISSPSLGSSSSSSSQRISDRLVSERNEDELARASRDEILDSLRAQWDEREKVCHMSHVPSIQLDVRDLTELQLLTRIGEMEEREQKCIGEKNDLGRALQAAQERLQTIYDEQASHPNPAQLRH